MATKFFEKRAKIQIFAHHNILEDLGKRLVEGFRKANVIRKCVRGVPGHHPTPEEGKRHGQNVKHEAQEAQQVTKVSTKNIVCFSPRDFLLWLTLVQSILVTQLHMTPLKKALWVKNWMELDMDRFLSTKIRNQANVAFAKLWHTLIHNSLTLTLH